MTPNNILCERVINQLQMEPNCWSFTFAVLITSIQLKQKVIRGVIWDGPSHQSLWTSPRAAGSIQPRRYLSCKAPERRSLPVQDLSARPCWWKRSPGAPPALQPRGAVAPWFSSLSCLLHCKFYPSPVWFHVATKGTEKDLQATLPRLPPASSHAALTLRSTLRFPSLLCVVHTKFPPSHCRQWWVGVRGTSTRCRFLLFHQVCRAQRCLLLSSRAIEHAAPTRTVALWSRCEGSTYFLKSLPSKAGTDLWGGSDIEGLQIMPHGQGSTVCQTTTNPEASIHVLVSIRKQRRREFLNRQMCFIPLIFDS